MIAIDTYMYLFSEEELEKYVLMSYSNFHDAYSDLRKQS